MLSKTIRILTMLKFQKELKQLEHQLSKIVIR